MSEVAAYHHGLGHLTVQVQIQTYRSKGYLHKGRSLGRRPPVLGLVARPPDSSGSTTPLRFAAVRPGHDMARGLETPNGASATPGYPEVGPG